MPQSSDNLIYIELEMTELDLGRHCIIKIATMIYRLRPPCILAEVGVCGANC